MFVIKNFDGIYYRYRSLIDLGSDSYIINTPHLTPVLYLPSPIFLSLTPSSPSPSPSSRQHNTTQEQDNISPKTIQPKTIHPTNPPLPGKKISSSLHTVNTYHISPPPHSTQKPPIPIPIPILLLLSTQNNEGFHTTKQPPIRNRPFRPPRRLENQELGRQGVGVGLNPHQDFVITCYVGCFFLGLQYSQSRTSFWGGGQCDRERAQ